MLGLSVALLGACGVSRPAEPAGAGAAAAVPLVSAGPSVVGSTAPVVPEPEPVIGSVPEPAADPAGGASGASESTTAAAAAGWSPSAAVVPRDQTRALVLAYHSFAIVPGRKREVLPSELERQIKHVRANGIEIIPLSRLVEWYDGKRELPRKVAVIMMDDAEKAQFTLAWPVLQREKVPFVVAIPTQGMILPKRSAMRFDWSDLKVMVDSGLCEVASHSHTHSKLTGLTTNELHIEVVRSKEILEEQGFGKVDVFVHPLGAYNGAVTGLLERAGYRVGFGIVGSELTHTSPRWSLGRWEVNGQTTMLELNGYLRRAKMTN